MPLSSSLFKNNRHLQACAREHPAHVTIGAVGEHVAKIQFALASIDRLAIDRSELLAQRYGTSTAAAVLKYKTKRAIINRSYQSVPDNLVGKMTIASLDDDMRARERLPKMVNDCQPGARARVLPAEASSVVASRGGAKSLLSFGLNAPDVAANKQLGGVVRIMVLFASNARGDGFPLGREIERARDCLFEHGVQLVVERGPTASDTFAFVERVLVNPLAEGDNVNELRKRCEDLVPGLPGILRVIVCHLGNFEFGHTIRGRRVGDQLFPPFALLNTEQVDRSNATLIHEMVHCSKPGPVPHDPEANSVFAATGTVQLGKTDRTTLRPEHAASIASSFFAIGGPRKKA